MRASKIFMATAMTAATFALGACSNSDEPEVVDLTKPIELNIGVGNVTQTRVDIANPTGFANGDNIGIYLATADKAADGSADGVSAEINTGKAVNNVKFSKTSDSWLGAIYWQNTSQWHTLYGYYPYDENLTGTNTSKSFTLATDQHSNGVVGGAYADGAGYKNADYLWAKNSPVMATTSAQPMELQHKMSRIVIKLTAGKDLSQDELSALAPSLKIVNKDADGNGNTPLNGKFDIKTGTISVVTEETQPTNAGTETATATKTAEITPYRVEGTVSVASVANSDEALKEYTYYAILLPGTSFAQNSDFVQLKASDETTYLYKLGTSNTLTMVAGTEYVFTLKANKTGISLSQFTIKAWESGTGDSDGDADMVVPEAKS